MKEKVIIYGGISIIFLGLLGFTLRDDPRFFAQENPVFSMCEDQIKAGLVAPTTYSRLKIEDVDKDTFWITYEASNAFNVRIRDTQLCNRQQLEAIKLINEAIVDGLKNNQ